MKIVEKEICDKLLTRMRKFWRTGDPDYISFEEAKQISYQAYKEEGKHGVFYEIAVIVARLGKSNQVYYDILKCLGIEVQ